MGMKSDTGPCVFRVNKRVCAVSGAVFAPGFRFCPNNNDLLTYLTKKNMEQDLDIVDCVIAVVDVYKYKHCPRELLKTHLPTGEQALYFFCPVTKKYPTSRKVNRSSEAGNWKMTQDDKQLCGMIRKTLVFHDSNRKRTNWFMHEYSLKDKENSERNECMSKVKYVLCKVYKKEPNVKDGEQAGACFGQREMEDWAYRDKIVIIPNPPISKISVEESLPMNTSVLDKSFQTSADNDNNTPDELRTTNKVNYAHSKPYGKGKPNVEDSQQAGDSFRETARNDISGSFISKQFESEGSPMCTSVLDELLQSSTELLGKQDKMHTEAATLALTSTPLMIFTASRVLSDTCVDEFNWCGLYNVRGGGDIHMEDPSGWDSNGRMF